MESIKAAREAVKAKYEEIGFNPQEILRLVMAELQVADVLAQVTLSLFTDFDNFRKFKPAAFQEQSINTLLD
jgi:hypothetical protein